MAQVEDSTMTWSSSLTVSELADAFHSAATEASRMSALLKLGATMAGRQRERAAQRALGNLQPKKFADMENELAFFTPQDDESPFSQSEKEPDFAAGASIPQRDGNPLAAHFYVEEHSTHREATLSVLFISSFGSAARRRRFADRCLSRLADSFRLADSGVPAA